MISSIPHKRVYLIISGLLITISFLMYGASTAFASTARSTIPRIGLVHTVAAAPILHRPWRRIPYGRQINNQFFRACVNNTNNKYYRGRDQGNSGNNGVNHGYNEDNSSNATNQVINRGPIVGQRINNQSFQICSNNAENFYYAGVRQGNSGNSGYNAGYNRDNSVNTGNQIIN